MTEAGFINGAPRYHQPQACQIDGEVSSVFNVTHDQFLSLEPVDLQQIFRKRHMLVRNVPHTLVEFKVDALVELVDPTLPVTVYDASLALEPSTQAVTVTTTLQDVFEQAQKAENGHILHAPHLPLISMLDQNVPGLRHLASTRFTWQRIRGTFGCNSFPFEELFSITVSMTNAVTPTRMKAAGQGFILQVVVGQVLVYLFSPTHNTLEAMTSTKPKDFLIESVLLTPGELLYVLFLLFILNVANMIIDTFDLAHWLLPSR